MTRRFGHGVASALCGRPEEAQRSDVARRRLATLVAAPSAALAVWAIIRLLGIDLVLEAGSTVGPLDVFAAAVFGAMAGWLVVALLERRSRRPRLLWSWVGSTTLAVSIIGPTWLADGTSAVALITLHVVTAAVLISGFASTLPVRCNGRRGPAQGWPERHPTR